MFYMKSEIISAISNEIYYKKKIEAKINEYNVCDFRYDSINNIFVFQDNSEKQKILQKWISAISTKYSEFIKNFEDNWDKHTNIFEHEGKIYFLVKGNNLLKSFSDEQSNFVIDSEYNLVLKFGAGFFEYLYLLPVYNAINISIWVLGLRNIVR